MTNLNTLETTLKAIEHAINALKNGQLTEEELAQFVEDSKELYEKAIVLRYKAYEEKVFGTNKPTAHLEENSYNNSEDLVVETGAEETETPSFEFGLFEPMNETFEEEVSEIVVEEELEEENEMDFEQATIFETASAIEIPISELPIEMELEVNTSSIASFEEAHHQTVEDEDEFLPENTSETNSSEEYSSEPYLKPSENRPDTSAIHSNLVQISTRVASHAGMMKLETLIGSFGLNERLQYINELFDGSSEGFSEAIKTIDHSLDLNQAIDAITGYANQHQWDLESETVEDFIVKVKRRYA